MRSVLRRIDPSGLVTCVAFVLWSSMLFSNAPAAQAGTVQSEQKISEIAGGFGGDLDFNDQFGYSASAIGDLNGDGIQDLAVGAYQDDDGGADQGAVWILFLNADGTVASQQKISETTGGFGAGLDPGDFFGYSVAALGDLNGDGNEDLAVGAIGDDDGGDFQGAVWILFLNADGTVASRRKISETTGGFGGVLDPQDFFGASVSAIGDLDGDGIEDLAVGTPRDDDGAGNQGAVWILFLNTNGTVASEQKISETTGGFGGLLDLGDEFGRSVAGLGDLDGDGMEDLAVGAWADDDGGAELGAVWVLFLDDDGTVTSEQKISATAGGFGGVLDAGDYFGRSVAALGDIDDDGNQELAVGALGDDDGGSHQGAAWILFLNDDGTVASEQKISETAGGFGGALDPDDDFASVAALGDLNGDGIRDLAVGAPQDDDGALSQGAVWILFLEGDTVAPVISCPSDITAECTGSAGTVVSFAPTATDDHDLSPTIVSMPASGSTFATGTTTVTCTATDNAGNSSMCSFDVTVEDTAPPVVTCPAEFTVEGTSPAGAVATFSPTAGDLCDTSPSVVAMPPSGSTFPLGTTIVTVTAADDSGNSAQCTFDITVEDTTPPDVTCPGDITRECTNPAGEVVTFFPTATDLCDPVPSVVAVPPSGSTFALGTTIVTVTATDGSGNQSMCTFSVTVEDTTDPLVVCPGNIMVECTGGGTQVSWSASASDACDPAPVVSCSPPSGSLFGLGTTTVTCTATDASGNAAMCSFDVTVVDTTDPNVTCPADVFLECADPGGEVVSFSVSATDGCDPAPGVSCVPASGSLFPIGTTTVTCTATDASGNTDVCTFDVTLSALDTTPPSISCPANMTVPCTSPDGAVVTFTTTASDACDPSPLVVCSPPSGSLFPFGTTLVSCTATDAAGNSAMCGFSVTVQDTVPPVVQCPPSQSVPAGTQAFWSASATDNCDGPVAAICSPPSGSFFPAGSTTVTCMATDSSGNTGFCTFTVTGIVSADVPALGPGWVALLALGALGLGLTLRRQL